MTTDLVELTQRVPRMLCDRNKSTLRLDEKVWRHMELV
jgi:hypothetical protein